MSSLRSLTYVQQHWRRWFFWVTFAYWRYVLIGPSLPWQYKPIHASWPQAVWCRLRMHPSGIVYYTHALATEPDTRCANCGEELG